MTGNVFGSIRALVAWMRLAWAPVGISVLIFSGVAQARSTPEGPVPDSCVVDAPNGATIIGATGQIVLAGGSTFTPPTCNASWAPTHPPVPGATATVAGGGLAEGWVMDSTAHPIENSGEYIFDDVEAYITVPNAPRNPSDTGQQFIWCGLENLIGGSWITVIQPEITWLDGAWYLQDQWVPNPTYLPGQNFITSPAEQVNPGDTLFCQVWQSTKIRALGRCSTTSREAAMRRIHTTGRSLGFTKLTASPPATACPETILPSFRQASFSRPGQTGTQR
jgi:hypothetical protein